MTLIYMHGAGRAGMTHAQLSLVDIWERVNNKDACMDDPHSKVPK